MYHTVHLTEPQEVNFVDKEGNIVDVKYIHTTTIYTLNCLDYKSDNTSPNTDCSALYYSKSTADIFD